MTQKQALYFETAFQSGNIAAAAESLFVSRSVVSRAVSELEKEFDASLFVRSKEGVKPTDAGHILHKLIMEISGSYTSVAESIRNLGSDRNSRLLRVCMTPTNAVKLYEVIFRDFLEEYPDVKLHIFERPAGQAVNLLLDGSADIIFTPQRDQLSSMFETIKLYRSRILLGIHESSPVAKKPELAIKDILNLEFGSLMAPLPIEDLLTSCFASFGKEPNFVVRTSSMELLRKMTEDGRIAVILPTDLMDKWENIARIPLDFFPESTHRMAWNRTIPHNSAFQDLIEYITRASNGSNYSGHFAQE